MKTERELFEEYELSKKPGANPQLLFRVFTKWDVDGDEIDYIGRYIDSDMEEKWLLWQAATQREGFKLVPVENIKSIYTSCNNALDINNVNVYKGLAMAIIDDCEDMIGVCDEG